MKRTLNEESASINRRSFLTRATVMSGAALLPFVGLARAGQNPGTDNDDKDCDRDKSGLAKGDRNIIIAAEIADALAVTTYMNIINTSPFFTGLSVNDQDYLTAALQEYERYLARGSVG